MWIDRQVVMQSREGWDMDRQEKHHWRGRKYMRRDLVETEDERMVGAAMGSRGVLGGCWRLAMHGRPPLKDGSEDGFRTFEAYAAS